jgi:hypothetical protein
VFDVFSDSRYSRNRVGGRVLHVLRQLARKAHRVYVLKMDCHKRPRIYHEHAIHWFPTIRVYAHGRQVECPRLRSIFPKTWSVFVQPRPQESDLDKLGIDGVLPADFEWTMVEDEGIRILTRAVRQGRAEEARRFRKLREAEENRLQQGGERVIPAASSGANEAADATLAEWSLARRRPLPTSALLGAVESRLHEAARTEKEVAIRYQGGSTPGETRRILPKELFAVEGFPRVYVLAHDVAKNEARVFRLDRISLA